METLLFVAGWLWVRASEPKWIQRREWITWPWRRTGGNDCNRYASAGFVAAHG